MCVSCLHSFLRASLHVSKTRLRAKHTQTHPVENETPVLIFSVARRFFLITVIDRSSVCSFSFKSWLDGA